MNRKQRATVSVVGFFLLGAATFGQQTTQSPTQPPPPPGGTPPRSVGKLTPLQPQAKTSPKPIPCTQRLKAQIAVNADLSNKVVELQAENEVVSRLYNDLTAKQQEAADKIAQLLKEKADLLEKQADLIEQAQKSLQNEHNLGLAAGMALNDVSGTWKIQNTNGGTGGICQVRVNYDSRTILVSNCRY